MKREIITTKDGSHTVYIPDLNVTYHSHHGAIQESVHVFIEAGLHYQLNRMDFSHQELRIFEMGFGTGLNAFLTLLEAEKINRKVQYTAIENYPLSEEEVKSLNYDQLLAASTTGIQQLHKTTWNETIVFTKNFSLKKIEDNLLTHSFEEQFHLIYYDAFAPSAQPELWTEEVFRKFYSMLLPNGILVTYCSKSTVRRAMQAAGFRVEKMPGPPGKREMVRATKSL